MSLPPKQVEEFQADSASSGGSELIGELGAGADIIVAYEPSKALVIKGTAGRFLPGDAFSAEQDDAWLTKLET